MHRLTLTILFFAGSCSSLLNAQMEAAPDPLLRETLKAVTTEVESCEKDFGSFKASLKGISDALEGLESQLTDSSVNQENLNRLSNMMLDPRVSPVLRLSTFETVGSFLHRAPIGKFSQFEEQIVAAEESADKLLKKVGAAEQAVASFIITTGDSDAVVKKLTEQLKKRLEDVQKSLPLPSVSILPDVKALGELKAKGDSLKSALDAWELADPMVMNDAATLLRTGMRKVIDTAKNSGLTLSDTENDAKAAVLQSVFALKELPKVIAASDATIAGALARFNNTWLASVDSYYGSVSKYIALDQVPQGDELVATEARRLSDSLLDALTGLMPSVEVDAVLDAYDTFDLAVQQLESLNKGHTDSYRKRAKRFAELGQTLNQQVTAANARIPGEEAEIKRDLQGGLDAAKELSPMFASRFDELRLQVEKVSLLADAVNLQVKTVVLAASQPNAGLDLQLASISLLLVLEDNVTLEKLLDDNSPEVSRAALTALIHLPEPPLAKLETLATGGDHLQQLAAIDAIEKIVETARTEGDGKSLKAATDVIWRLLDTYTTDPKRFDIQLGVALQGLQAGLGEPKPAAPAEETPATPPATGTTPAKGAAGTTPTNGTTPAGGPEPVAPPPPE